MYTIELGRVDGNSSYNSMGDNWGSHRFAQVKLEFLKTYILSPSEADTSPKQKKYLKFSKIYCIFTLFLLKSMKI